MTERKRVRIVDIADELGVSTATVSNVIHGKTKKISDETVKRVQQLLEEREYVPSMAGILLAQNSSSIIGVIINDHPKYEKRLLEDPFISSAVNALSYEIDKAGYFMMIKSTVEISDIIQFASMWNLSGMVLIGFCEQDYKNIRERMRIPFVIYDGTLKGSEKIGNIVIDNFDGGYQVGKHFIDLGHQRILYLSDNEIFMDWQRYQGCKKAAEEGEAKVDFMLIPMQREERLLFYRENYRKLREYTAIFAASDFYAIEIMQFLMEQGVNIPYEMSVAGFDDTPICRQIVPNLTTVKQDCGLRAKTAISFLQKLKDGESQGEEIVLPVNLVIRNSTAKYIKNV